jgi:flagellar biosynthesis protein FlhF
VAEDTEQLSMSTLSFQDYVRERMLRRRGPDAQMEEEVPACPLLPARTAWMRARHRTAAHHPTVAKHNPLRGMAIELPGRGAQARPGRPALNTQVMGELQSMKDLIEERFNTLTWLGQTRQNPIQSSLMHKLIRAGYSPALGRALIEHARDAGPATPCAG